MFGKQKWVLYCLKKTNFASVSPISELAETIKTVKLSLTELWSLYCHLLFKTGNLSFKVEINNADCQHIGKIVFCTEDGTKATNRKLGFPRFQQHYKSVRTLLRNAFRNSKSSTFKSRNLLRTVAVNRYLDYATSPKKCHFHWQCQLIGTGNQDCRGLSRRSEGRVLPRFISGTD